MNSSRGTFSSSGNKAYESYERYLIERNTRTRATKPANIDKNDDGVPIPPVIYLIDEEADGEKQANNTVPNMFYRFMDGLKFAEKEGEKGINAIASSLSEMSSFDADGHLAQLSNSIGHMAADLIEDSDESDSEEGKDSEEGNFDEDDDDDDEEGGEVEVQASPDGLVDLMDEGASLLKVSLASLPPISLKHVTSVLDVPEWKAQPVADVDKEELIGIKLENVPVH